LTKSVPKTVLEESPVSGTRGGRALERCDRAWDGPLQHFYLFHCSLDLGLHFSDPWEPLVVRPDEVDSLDASLPEEPLTNLLEGREDDLGLDLLDELQLDADASLAPFLNEVVDVGDRGSGHQEALGEGSEDKSLHVRHVGLFFTSQEESCLDINSSIPCYVVGKKEETLVGLLHVPAGPLLEGSVGHDVPGLGDHHLPLGVQASGQAAGGHVELESGVHFT